MSDIPSCKSAMRAELRERRRSLSEEQQRAAAQSLPNIVNPFAQWQSARRIALYLATDGEIDPAALAVTGRSLGKELFLPVVENNMLEFARWREADELSVNRFGIGEPTPGAERCTAQDLDLIFLPLVAWDRSGGRLGMGGGFYDRALAQAGGPLRVGLGHRLQEVASVPRQEFDVRLDYVATDSELIECLDQ